MKLWKRLKGWQLAVVGLALAGVVSLIVVLLVNGPAAEEPDKVLAEATPVREETPAPLETGTNAGKPENAPAASAPGEDAAPSAEPAPETQTPTATPEITAVPTPTPATQTEQPVPSAEASAAVPTSLPTPSPAAAEEEKETAASLKARYQVQLDELKSGCTNTVHSIVDEVAAALKESDGDTESLTALQQSYLPRIIQEEAACDQQFSQLMSEAQADYDQAGVPAGDISLWRGQYEEAKEAARNRALQALMAVFAPKN